jgi:hypothetical protein
MSTNRTAAMIERSVPSGDQLFGRYSMLDELSDTEHYAGFAHLPLTDPHASADELQRAVERLGFQGRARQRRNSQPLSRRPVI